METRIAVDMGREVTKTEGKREMTKAEQVSAFVNARVKRWWVPAQVVPYPTQAECNEIGKQAMAILRGEA